MRFLNIDKLKKRNDSHSKLFFLASFIFIAVSSTSQFLLIPNGSPQGDSFQYGYGNSRNWDLLSFSGMAIRKWPEVLINTLLGKQFLQVACQFTVSFLVWIFLLNEIRKHFKNNIAAMLLLTILACSPHVNTWNSTLLSESYLISALIFLIGATIRFIKSDSLSNFIFFSIAIFMFLNIKPAVMYPVFLSLIFFGMLALVKILTTSVNSIRYQKKITARVFVIFLILFYTLFTNIIQSKETFGWSLSYRAAGAVTVFSNANPQAELVTSELSKVEELKCIEVFKIRSSDENANLLRDKCPEARNWLSNKFPLWYSKFILQNPSYAAKLFFTGVSMGNSPYSFYSGSISVVPGSINSLFFGSRNLALRQTLQSAQEIDLNKIIVTSPLIGWITISLILIYCKRKSLFSSELCSDSVKLQKFLIYLLILGLFGIATSSILNPNEWFRQSIVYQIMIFVSTSLLFLSEDHMKLEIN